MSVSSEITNKPITTIQFTGFVDKFINENSSKLLIEDLKNNKIEPSKYLMNGYIYNIISNNESKIIIDIIKEPIINIDAGNINNDLTPYFKDKDLQKEFNKDLINNCLNDFSYYITDNTLILIKKKKHKYNLKFRLKKIFKYYNNDTSLFLHKNKINKFEKDYIFNSANDNSYFKKGYTFTSLPTKQENVILIKIIPIDEKKKYNLKLKLHEKMYSISRKGIKEYNERLLKEKKEIDKKSYIKYMKAKQIMGNKMNIPSPHDIMKDLHKYEHMIKVFTSEEFRKQKNMGDVYNYFNYIKQKYEI